MNDKGYKIIAVLDTIEDKLIAQSLELIAFAESYESDNLSNALIVLPGKDVYNISMQISEKYGIDTVAVEHDTLKYPNPELLTEILSSIIKEYKPELMLFTHTMRNCQIASKLSVKTGMSSISAVESFTNDSEGTVFQRSIFNGKLKMNIRPETEMKILTVVPGAYILDEKVASYKKNALTLLRKYSEKSSEEANLLALKGYKPISLSSEMEGGGKLEDADVIVSAGRGIGKEENLELIRETAAIFQNSAIGGSRPVCDQRWLPLNQQVGVTGKTVSPKLYMACGISGSQQHIAGIKNSQVIVAINKDPNSAIFAISDYIVVEDLVYFLPVIVKKYREKSGR